MSVAKLHITLGARQEAEYLAHVVATGQKFDVVTITIPEDVMVPPDEEEMPEKSKSKSSDQAVIPPKPQFWRVTEDLFSTVGRKVHREIESPKVKPYNVYRTQLYSNSDIGFLPLWTTSFSDVEHDTYHTAAWELLVALERSGLPYFSLDPSPWQECKLLHGGRDNIAEGASYKICTRLMKVKEQTKLVAVKVIKGSLLRSDRGSRSNNLAASGLHTIRKDIEVMKKLQHRKQGVHPHVLSCLGYGWNASEEGELSAFLVVPLAHYGTLREFLQGFEISHPMKKEIFTQICLGLRSLHLYEIVHGDIKMENVLVFKRRYLETEEGIRNYEPPRREFPQISPIAKNVHICLSDFGCSVATSRDKYFGTTAYNAPEVRSGAINDMSVQDNISKHMKCDMFSCGLLLLEILLDGQSIASNDQVQDMDVRGQKELQALHFALDLVLQISVTLKESERERLMFKELYKDIFLSTLRLNPDLRRSVAHLLDLIESVQWRIAFSSNNDEHPTEAMSWSLYNPILQSRKLDPQPSSRSSLPPIKLSDMPRSMVSRNISSWYETSINGKGKAADDAADNTVSICLNREWTKITDTDQFVSIIEKYVKKSCGQSALFIYYRLLYSLDRALPTLIDDDPRRQEILSLEYDLLTKSLSNAEYEYQRMRSYRRLRRWRAMGSAPKELIQGHTHPGTMKESTLHHLWQDVGMRHAFQNLRTVEWLVQIGEISILQELVDEYASITTDAFLLHMLLTEACMAGNLEILELFIRVNSFDFAELEFPDKLRPFYYLGMFDHVDVDRAVSLLARAGYDTNAYLDKADANQYVFWPQYEFWGTPLSMAVMRNRIDIVRSLLDHGADVKTRGRHQISPINIAARCNRPEMVDLLCASLRHRGDITFSPLRSLSIGIPYSQELANGTEKINMLRKTIEVLIKHGFDINEQFEIVPEIGYREQISVFERALRDYDFTVDFSILDALLDYGFTRELSAESLPLYLQQHHEKIQVRLMAYLIDRKLVTLQSDLRGLVYNLIYRGMAGALEVLLRGFPDCRATLAEKEPLALATSMNAEIEIVTVLLDYGAPVNGALPSISFRETQPPSTNFTFVVSNGRPDTIDLFIDRGVEVTPKLLVSFCATLDLRVQEKHVIHHLLRMDETSPDSFRHPNVISLLVQTIDNQTVHATLLEVAITELNLDAILGLLSPPLQIPSRLYERLTMKLITRVIVASCLDQSTQNEYVKEKGFDSLHQLHIAVWKLLVHWALQRTDAEHDPGFSYLHWAALMLAPEVVRKLIAGGADVFGEDRHGDVALDVTSTPFSGQKEGPDGIPRLYGLLFREYVCRTGSPWKGSTVPASLDAETLRAVRRNAFLGTYEFQLRQIATAEILNSRMLCERAPVSWSSEEKEQSRFCQHMANYWTLLEAHEELVYVKTWLESVPLADILRSFTLLHSGSITGSSGEAPTTKQGKP